MAGPGRHYLFPAGTALITTRPLLTTLRCGVRPADAHPGQRRAGALPTSVMAPFVASSMNQLAQFIWVGMGVAFVVSIF